MKILRTAIIAFAALAMGVSSAQAATVIYSGTYDGSYQEIYLGDISRDMRALEITLTIDSTKITNFSLWEMVRPSVGLTECFGSRCNSWGEQFEYPRSVAFTPSTDGFDGVAGILNLCAPYRGLICTSSVRRGIVLNGAPIDGPVNFTLKVSAIPEPATWAMMIIGFGAVGSMVRTSRRRNAFPAA